MSGGDARLKILLAELPPVEFKFHRVRWHEFTALYRCSVEMISSAYFKLVEIIESQSLELYLDNDQASSRAYKELHHYRIFLDEIGCHDIFAESVSLETDSGILSLEDYPRWSKLQHAYGAAGDIPDLLRQLASLPSAEGKQEPWWSLWSSLAHQGDVYSASFAAVPHVVRALTSAPAQADSTYFHFPAWVEVCRQKSKVEVPEDLAPAYFAALAKLPSLVATAAGRPWDDAFLACALSAIAAAKGYGAVAEAVQELTPKVAEEFMEWFFNR